MNFREEIVSYIEKIAKREGIQPSIVCDRLTRNAFIHARLKAGTGTCTMRIAQKFKDAARSRKTLVEFIKSEKEK